MDIGRHCHECRQLDFLPFDCPKCQQTFCGSHRQDHVCKVITPPTKPVSKPVSGTPQAPEAPESNYKLGTQVQEARQQRQAAQRAAEDKRRAQKQQHAQQTVKNKSTLQWLRESLKINSEKSKITTVKSEAKNRIEIRKKAVGDSKVSIQSRVYYQFSSPDQEIKDPISQKLVTIPGKTVDLYFDKSWSAGRALDSAKPYLGLQNACKLIYNSKPVNFTDNLSAFPQFCNFVVTN